MYGDGHRQRFRDEVRSFRHGHLLRARARARSRSRARPARSSPTARAHLHELLLGDVHAHGHRHRHAHDHRHLRRGLERNPCLEQWHLRAHGDSTPTTTGVTCVPGSVAVGQGRRLRRRSPTTVPGRSPILPAQSPSRARARQAFTTPGRDLHARLRRHALTFTSSCSATYTPTAIGTGTHTITGTYDEASSATHSSSSGTFALTVTQPHDHDSSRPAHLASPSSRAALHGDRHRQRLRRQVRS